MRKPEQIKWDVAVKEAQKMMVLLRLQTQHRMRVSELALGCCEKSHGGRVDDKQYTLAKFAEDVGMNRSTLYEWISIYEDIYLKLTPDQRADADQKWVAVTETRRKTKGLSNQSAKKVQSEFKKQISMTGSATALAKYSKVMNSILHNAKNPRRIMDSPIDLLKELCAKCFEAAELLRKEIEFRESGEVDGAPIEIENPKPGPKFWEEEEVGVHR